MFTNVGALLLNHPVHVYWSCLPWIYRTLGHCNLTCSYIWNRLHKKANFLARWLPCDPKLHYTKLWYWLCVPVVRRIAKPRQTVPPCLLMYRVKDSGGDQWWIRITQTQ